MTPPRTAIQARALDANAGSLSAHRLSAAPEEQLKTIARRARASMYLSMGFREGATTYVW